MSRIVVQHPPSGSAASPAIRPRDLWDIIKRRRRLMLTWIVLATVATIMVVVWWPRTYASSAQLFVRMGRENVMLDPTATTGQTLNLHRTRESEINSVIQILKSDQIANRVVESFDLQEVRRGREAGQGDDASNPISVLRSIKSSLSAWVGSLDPLSDRERALRKFKSSMEVSAPMDSNVVAIKYNARSPEFAHQVAEVVTEVFLEENLRLNRTEGSFDFYLDQEQQVRTELDTALTKLRDAKTESGVASVIHHQEALEQRMATIHEWLSTNRSQLAASQAKVKALKKTARDTPDVVTTETVTGVGNNAREGMRQQLYELEILESELLSKYTDAHPKILGLRKQRTEAENILAEHPADRTEKRVGLNPIRQQTDLQLLTEEATVASLESEHAALQRELEEVGERLTDLNRQEVKIAQLQTTVDLARVKYQVLTEKLEQARIVEALEEQQITSVNVVQPASFEEKPVSPKVGLTLALGLIGSLGGACGLALAAEYLDTSFTHPAQVEHQLGLPVLVSIPRATEAARQQPAQQLGD